MLSYSLLAIIMLPITPLRASGQDDEGQVGRVQAQSKKPDLSGVWFLDVTPSDTVPPPFKMLITFNADGTLIQTENDALAPPFFLTPGHGVWAKTGAASFAFTMVQLTFDNMGNYTGKLTVRTAVTLDSTGNSFTSVMKVSVTDPGGNEVFSTGGAANGSRISYSLWIEGRGAPSARRSNWAGVSGGQASEYLACSLPARGVFVSKKSRSGEVNSVRYWISFAFVFECP